MYIIESHNGDIEGVAATAFEAIKSAYEHDGKRLDYVQDEDGWFHIRVSGWCPAENWTNECDKYMHCVKDAWGETIDEAAKRALRNYEDWDNCHVFELAAEIACIRERLGEAVEDKDADAFVSLGLRLEQLETALGGK